MYFEAGELKDIGTVRAKPDATTAKCPQMPT